MIFLQESHVRLDSDSTAVLVSDRPGRSKSDAAISEGARARWSAPERSIRSRMKAARSLRRVRSADPRRGHGRRHVQFASLTSAGVLMRSRQPKTSWIGTSAMSEPERKSDVEDRVADRRRRTARRDRSASAEERRRRRGVRRAGASSHHSAFGSVSCVPLVATETRRVGRRIPERPARRDPTRAPSAAP